MVGYPDDDLLEPFRGLAGGDERSNTTRTQLSATRAPLADISPSRRRGLRNRSQLRLGGSPL